MKINNCKFRYQCPETWEALIYTADDNIKYCPVCDKGVHFCRTDSDIEQAQSKRWCIAIEQPQLKAKRPNKEGTSDETMILMGDLVQPDFD